VHDAIAAEGAVLSVRVERARVAYKKALDRPFCTLSLLSAGGAQLEPPVGPWLYPAARRGLRAAETVTSSPNHLICLRRRFEAAWHWCRVHLPAPCCR
jgi:hypothetical protein